METVTKIKKIAPALGEVWICKKCGLECFVYIQKKGTKKGCFKSDCCKNLTLLKTLDSEDIKEAREVLIKTMKKTGTK